MLPRSGSRFATAPNMAHATTNLLPENRQKALHRAYFFRLGVVAVLLASFLVIAAGALLLPTYVYLSTSTKTKEASLAALTATLSSGDDASLSARLAALSKDAATLEALGKAPSVTAAIASVLDVPHAGVALTSFIYAPPTAAKGATVAVSGTAKTRDALRSYQLALQSAPFVRSVDLPVSAYAKDIDASFTVTLTLAP